MIQTMILAALLGQPAAVQPPTLEEFQKAAQAGYERVSRYQEGEAAKEVEKLEQFASEVRRGTKSIRVNGRAVSRDAQIREATRYLKERKEFHENAAKMLKDRLAKKPESFVPDITLNGVGNWGRMKDYVRVVQVIDKDEMLVDPFDNRPLIWLRGISTADVVDDQKVGGLSKWLFWVPEKKTYRTALGTTNTVYVIEPLDPSKLKKAAKESP